MRVLGLGSGHFRALPRPEALYLGERFGVSGERGRRGRVGSGAEPELQGCSAFKRYRMNRMGAGIGRDQASWNRSKALAAARGGARAGKPRCVRILVITGGCSMAAMIFKVPPQCGQCSISISNTRLSSRAQLMGAGAAGGGSSAWSAEGVLALTGTFGMISNSGKGDRFIFCTLPDALGLASPRARRACGRSHQQTARFQ